VGAIVAGLLAGALLGVAVLLAGPLPVLMGVAGILVALLAFRYPEALVVLMLALASQLIPSRFNIFVDLIVGRFQVSDLLLFWLLFVSALRVFMEKDFAFRSSSLDRPLVLFYLAVVGGLATAVLLFDVSFRNATYEARTLTYYLAFFPITTLVRTRRALVRLSIGVIGVAVLMAVSMLLHSTIQPAILADDWTLDVDGVVRVFHPGFSAVYVGLLMLAGYLATGGGRHRARDQEREGATRGVHNWWWLQWAVMLFLAAALFSTLARNLLIAGTVSFGLLTLLLDKEQRLDLFRMLLRVAVSLAVVLVVLVLLFDSSTLITRYAVAYAGRLERMFSDQILSRQENLYSRWEEMRFALHTLRDHPILGTGLYNPYRPPFYEGEAITLRHFIHNAYLGIWLKTGIAGLISFLWLSVAFLLQGFRGWKRVSQPLLRGVALGCVVAYVGLMLANLVAPSFLQPGSLVIVGVTLGLATSILLLDGDPDEHSLLK